MANVGFENSQPILRVDNLKAAIAFYERLGFRNAEWALGDFTSVNRDRAGVYLCEGAQGRGGAWVWFGVEDAGELHQQYVAAGIPILKAPENHPWAYEFHVEDPDGNVLRFASEAK